MNKAEFLEELKQHLNVLEDSEQADILEEYAQHIDMKTSSGLTEEEAIRDFGDLKELAAGILEAYHVKPDYGKTGKKKWRPDREKANTESSKAHRINSQSFRHLLHTLKGFASRCRDSGAAFFKKAASVIAAPFRHFKNRAEENPRITRPASCQKGRVGGFLRRTASCTGSILASCWFFLLGCALWCLRLAWNCCIAAVSLFSGIFTLFALFFLGAITVCLFDGYPLAGPVLICLGTTLCGGAFTAFCLTLFLRKRKSKEPETAETVELSEPTESAAPQKPAKATVREEVHHA